MIVVGIMVTPLADSIEGSETRPLNPLFLVLRDVLSGPPLFVWECGATMDSLDPPILT